MSAGRRKGDEDEVDVYFRNERARGHGTVTYSERINWWRQRKAKLPGLFEVAMEVGTIQATACAPERQFSRAKRQLTKFHLRIGLDTLDAAITCGENIDLTGEVLEIDPSLLKLLHAQRAKQTRLNPAVAE
jgi:hypothetical protein